jgi:hypothetical protein
MGERLQSQNTQDIRFGRKYIDSFAPGTSVDVNIDGLKSCPKG